MSTPVCGCGEPFRFEFCDLASGRVRKVLVPASAEWQTELNEVGTGSLTFGTRELTARDVWPGLTSVYILLHDEVQFAGMVDAYDPKPGTTRVGLKSLEYYWTRRHLDETVVFRSTNQNEIAASLVAETNGNGIPLFGQADGSIWVRHRTYNSWERKVVFDAIQELTQVIGGPDWELRHEKIGGAWRTTAVFRDTVGIDRGVRLCSGIEVHDYSLSVDGSQLATHVDAIGAGEEQDQLIATADDDSGIYPRFDAAPAWKDVSVPDTLQSHAEGYLDLHREPVAVPAVAVAGTKGPEVRLGDIVSIEFDDGACTFYGQARVVAISWSVSPDNAPTRTFQCLPLTRASESVLNQQSAGLCETGDC